MTQEDYDSLCIKEGAIQLSHPEFDVDYQRNAWSNYPVTVLICQRQTKQMTQLCLESLLRFYPDIKIVIVDGDSQDDSTLYLKYKALTNPNITIFERTGRTHSHGETMDDAIRKYVDTEFVVTLDSDVIVNRGGWIQGLHHEFLKDPTVYAAGSLMLVTRENYAIGPPKDESDVLRYAHPSCSMYHVPRYKAMAPFADHGAPCCYNMIDAANNGFKIAAFPIDKFVSHRMGSSWVKEHKIVWPHDYNVPLRPFITFVGSSVNQMKVLAYQKDKDFNIVISGANTQIRIWETTTRDIDNPYYDIRFAVTGEYVVVFDNLTSISDDLVTEIKQVVIDNGAADVIPNNDGFSIFKREYFQEKIALY